MQKVIVLAALGLAGTAHAEPAQMERADVVALPPKPRPPAPPPRPAAEIATVGKQLAGTWTCTGAVDKVTIQLALDDAWIRWTITGGAGTTLSFRTYDAIAKQWTMFELTSSGKHRTTTSLGEDKGEWTWTLDTQREHEKLDGKTLELWGERKRGDTWAKSYTASCHR